MATLEEELNQLEKDIRQLRIEYDSYFAGGRPRAPADIEWRVNQVIKKYAGGRRMNYAQRFRYDGLVQRFAKFRELWRQRTRQKEAGLSPYLAAGVAQREAARVEARPGAPPGPRRPYHAAFNDPLREPEKVQQLYRILLDARQKVGEIAEVNFEQFHRFVRKKTEQLKRQLGCHEVEYTVSVENDQVKLKAKGK
ncbi:MAG: MXAN_5187 C-terminal domain-containing protein [Terriglobia bacterium]